MLRSVSIMLITAWVLLGSLAGCGGGQKEVVIQGPSEAERAAQFDKMTPEQKQMVEMMKSARPGQPQEGNAPGAQR